MKDFQRSKVYGAEHALQSYYDVAEGAPIVSMMGMTLQLEPEDTFTRLDEVQAYITRVVSNPAVVAAFGHRGMVTVRRRKGAAKAHYEPRNNVIAVADHGSGWAMRELVILHELAHHFSPGEQHGPRFVGNLVELVGIVIGPQAALAMRILYDIQGAKAS